MYIVYMMNLDLYGFIFLFYLWFYVLSVKIRVWRDLNKKKRDSNCCEVSIQDPNTTITKSIVHPRFLATAMDASNGEDR